VQAFQNIYLRDLLLKLADGYGEPFHRELFNADGLRDDVMVTVNGVIINHANVAELALNNNDVIALLPVFPGGG